MSLAKPACQQASRTLGEAFVGAPLEWGSTLIRTGTIQDTDFIGQKMYRLADGSTVPSATFLIRSLKVGNHLLENVLGSVASAKADLLLGQSFLVASTLGRLTINDRYYC